MFIFVIYINTLKTMSDLDFDFSQGFKQHGWIHINMETAN